MRRRRVYIVNRSAHDFSPAAKYGELVYVTEGMLDRYATTNHVRLWMEALKDSEPEDYIILSSMNVVCGIGCALFALMHGRLNLLIFRYQKYVAKELRLDDVLLASNIVPTWIQDFLNDLPVTEDKEIK